MDDKLTVASIYNRKSSEKNILNVNISLSNKFNVNDYPFAFQSTTENQTKLTIYPIKKERIIKITLFGQNVSDNTSEMLS